MNTVDPNAAVLAAQNIMPAATPAMGASAVVAQPDSLASFNPFAMNVNDNDESLSIKSGGKFGLNQKVMITEFAAKAAGTVPNKDNVMNAQPFIQLVVKIQDREYNSRFYPVTKVYNKAYPNGEGVPQSDPAFIDLFKEQWKQTLGTIVHVVKSFGVTQEQIDTHLANCPNGFGEYATRITGLVAPMVGTAYQDVFVQWQYKIRGGKDKTYLELPNNMLSGRWICKHVPGEFTEVISAETGLTYVDPNNQVHPISKSPAFLASKNAEQQKTGASAAQDAINNAPATATW